MKKKYRVIAKAKATGAIMCDTIIESDNIVRDTGHLANPFTELKIIEVTS